MSSSDSTPSSGASRDSSMESELPRIRPPYPLPIPPRANIGDGGADGSESGNGEADSEEDEQRSKGEEKDEEETDEESEKESEESEKEDEGENAAEDDEDSDNGAAQGDRPPPGTSRSQLENWESRGGAREYPCTLCQEKELECRDWAGPGAVVGGACWRCKVRRCGPCKSDDPNAPMNQIGRRKTSKSSLKSKARVGSETEELARKTPELMAAVNAQGDELVTFNSRLDDMGRTLDRLDDNQKRIYEEMLEGYSEISGVREEVKSLKKTVKKVAANVEELSKSVKELLEVIGVAMGGKRGGEEKKEKKGSEEDGEGSEDEEEEEEGEGSNQDEEDNRMDED
ncbi:hypothetical protein ONZ45_g15830 [Pleurotus djamor]|nr:hypothetical protein ONZ45_g15830 [Pleurotus djamor]